MRTAPIPLHTQPPRHGQGCVRRLNTRWGGVVPASPCPPYTQPPRHGQGCAWRFNTRGGRGGYTCLPLPHPPHTHPDAAWGVHGALTYTRGGHTCPPTPGWQALNPVCRPTNMLNESDQLLHARLPRSSGAAPLAVVWVGCSFSTPTPGGQGRLPKAPGTGTVERPAGWREGGRWEAADLLLQDTAVTVSSSEKQQRALSHIS